MGSEQEQIRSIAERIARRLADAGEGSGGERGDAGTEATTTAADLAALRAGLSEIQRRLAHLESHLTDEEECGGHARDAAVEASPRGRQSSPRYEPTGSAPPSTPSTATVTRSPWLSGTYVPATAAAVHPSEERFGIQEAVSEIVDYFEREKTCNVEPGGKPCDHCAMCSSRGF